MKKLGFKLVILLSFEMLANKLDLVTQSITLKLNTFIINLFLKFIDMIKILLRNSYIVLKLKK